MKALLILLSPFLLISASHLTDAAAIEGAQKVDSTIGVPPPHPNVLLQRPSQWTDTRNAAEQAAAQAGGKAVDEAVGKAIGSLFGGGGFFVVPASAYRQPFYRPPPLQRPPIYIPPRQQPPQHSPAVHPHVLFQQPSTWTDIRDAGEKAALGAVLGGLFGR